ncbi:MAG TPA: SagB/ThcOx family dehydrogenase [Deltaproteobacteria bacterium]|nr:SagB/ThcOx family dehydrogenase [Deltaproteobacteria bacterium]HPR55803.1 SagB/ThcOx family dehydrogenase [Deltaproteobacteria bacterium]HXK46079.1 SagB/ThcOx family dehydrogenase [Deltaproteobacteria bacterium]
MGKLIGERFQQETKYDRWRMPEYTIDPSRKPLPYKEYPNAKVIPMERPQKCGEMTLYEAILRRKSLRRFVDAPVSMDSLSCLLWASSGIQRREMGFAFRTAPSAGALYPVETYAVVHQVEGIAQGVYHYNVKGHVLEEIKRGDFRAHIAQAALGQIMCAQASVVIAWTALFERSLWKYRQRAYRYVYLDAGHMAQNLALASTSIGLGSCQVGALFDDEVNEILGVDGIQESILYMSVVGQTGLFV